VAKGIDIGLPMPAGAGGYGLIFALELLFMVLTLAAMWPLLNRDTQD